MSAENTFNQLPGVAKVVIVVAGTAVTLFIGYKIYSHFQDLAVHAGDYKESNDVKNDLNKAADKGIKPSYSESQYSAWANDLFTAMDGYGHNFNSIIHVIVQMKNDADVLKLIDAYGIRELSSGRGNPAPNFKGTLSGAFTEKLSHSSNSANDEFIVVNKDLASKGIKIRF